MLESVGVVGALAAVGVIAGRVLILAIALRGMRPCERPAIIRALTGFVRVTRMSERPGLTPSGRGGARRPRRRLARGGGARSG
ncbi:hypothetical protein [Saccharothrix longispora]|uniref:hypothetical protein n=1 Tax=Saccharothrix longispora TaxID=33920 RepID=UPI0028FDC38A|nr:hypothetical protein [Saccharothrix longispora]MDU0295017.1 hypothetical protein [Saccharothrix longispora]